MSAVVVGTSFVSQVSAPRNAATRRASGSARSRRTSITYRNWRTSAEKHLPRRTISLNKSILVQMYDYAMELRLVESNPARNAKLPRQPGKIDDGDNKVIPIAQREPLLRDNGESA